jgi:TRAP-type C4-dicarboxylate transport system permease small subunit
MRKVRDVFGKIVTGISYVGILACLVIVVMTTVDVLLRKIGDASVLGSTEITEMLMVVMMAFGIPALQIVDGHVKVDLLVKKMPGRSRFFFESAILLAEAAVVGLMTWGTYNKVINFYTRGTSTGVLRIPETPFAACMCLGLALFCVLLLMDAVITFLDGLHYKKS